jgi:glycosyltransferase involved in cell wall biosynthesis
MNPDNPFLSIIIPHYDGAITDDELEECLHGLSQQMEIDFEVILLHDGPQSRPFPDLDRYPQFPIRKFISKRRFDDWGHSLRNIGIKKAKGKYILHLNPDNIVYKSLVYRLKEEVNKEYPVLEKNEEKASFNKNILVFPILARARLPYKHTFWRPLTKSGRPLKELEDFKIVLSGWPMQLLNVDAMQVVIKREMYNKYDGWFAFHAQSDYDVYAFFVNENGGSVRYIPEILGEHR